MVINLINEWATRRVVVVVSGTIPFTFGDFGGVKAGYFGFPKQKIPIVRILGGRVGGGRYLRNPYEQGNHQHLEDGYGVIQERCFTSFLLQQHQIHQ